MNKKHLSRVLLMMICLFSLMLIVSCGAAPSADVVGEQPAEESTQAPTDANAPQESEEESEETKTAEGTMEDPAMRTAEIFDRSQDEGKLSARFFHIRIQDTPTSFRKSGDHTLLTSPDGKTMLIDCGTPTAGPLLVDALKKMGITSVDYLVISHTHADHIGGIPDVLANIDVGQIYMNHDTTDGEGGYYYDRLMNAVELRNIPLERVCEGFTFSFGKEVQVKFYNPPVDYDYLAVPDGVEQRNNSSLAMRMVYKDSSFFFGGDDYYKAEERLIDTYGSELESGLVKMDHHGYMESNSLDWTKTIKPRVAVATYGSDSAINNMYLAAGAKTFFVYQDGSVYVSTAGDGQYTVITEQNRSSKILKGETNDTGHYLIG